MNIILLSTLYIFLCDAFQQPLPSTHRLWSERGRASLSQLSKHNPRKNFFTVVSGKRDKSNAGDFQEEDVDDNNEFINANYNINFDEINKLFDDVPNYGVIRSLESPY